MRYRDHNREWTTMPLAEYQAIEASGRSTLAWYLTVPTIPHRHELLTDTTERMHGRPNQTDEGATKAPWARRAGGLPYLNGPRQRYHYHASSCQFTGPVHAAPRNLTLEDFRQAVAQGDRVCHQCLLDATEKELVPNKLLEVYQTRYPDTWGQRWGAAEIGKLMRLARAGHTWDQISAALRRTKEACKRKWIRER